MLCAGFACQAEQKFVTTQEQRREKQQRILQLQSQLKEIHAELDKTHRGEDRYLTLITQEHAIIKEERSLLEQFKNLEKAERDYFASLSLALRESHEKERAQGERTKYWSIIGSQRELLEKETKEIKALLAADRALQEGEEDVKRAAVYIGEDVRDIVADSQRQLEWKMKSQLEDIDISANRPGGIAPHSHGIRTRNCAPNAETGFG
ncbi:hypothetical protein HPB50_012582 [Hyalomma asiaticum]|uniref:Uncharacterized protein n=1 Tax=Hyalomma asiaticum TaxID=266040 RepID=A0ACB7S2Q5_HYAAI|nr:hypothetical protein HPB50_012582 [Hyalomma asiaticum]